MTEIIAYCGINCSECPAYQATMKNDIAELERTAEKWSQNGPKLTAKDVTCEGCFSKRLSKYCTAICTIRPCAINKKIENCAHCNEYKCEKLSHFLQDAPNAAKRLEELHKNL